MLKANTQHTHPHSSVLSFLYLLFMLSLLMHFSYIGNWTQSFAHAFRCLCQWAISQSSFQRYLKLTSTVCPKDFPYLAEPKAANPVLINPAAVKSSEIANIVFPKSHFWLLWATEGSSGGGEIVVWSIQWGSRTRHSRNSAKKTE